MSISHLSSPVVSAAEWPQTQTQTQLELQRRDLTQKLMLSDLELAELDCKRIFEKRDLNRVVQRKFDLRLKRKNRSPNNTCSTPTATKRKKSAQLPRLEDDAVRLLAHAVDRLAALLPAPDGRASEACEWRWGEFVNVDLALIQLRFARGDFAGVHEAVRRSHHAIPKHWELEIEELWYHSAYHLWLSKKIAGRFSSATADLMRSYAQDGMLDQLNPVNRYRIRKRFECPTVANSGGRKYKISSHAQSLMWRHFRLNQRPAREVKREIALETGLDVDTVSNWFKNKRQRCKQDAMAADRRLQAAAASDDLAHSPPTFTPADRTSERPVAGGELTDTPPPQPSPPVGDSAVYLPPPPSSVYAPLARLEPLEYDDIASELAIGAQPPPPPSPSARAPVVVPSATQSRDVKLEHMQQPIVHFHQQPSGLYAQPSSGLADPSNTHFPPTDLNCATYASATINSLCCSSPSASSIMPLMTPCGFVDECQTQVYSSCGGSSSGGSTISESDQSSGYFGSFSPAMPPQMGYEFADCEIVNAYDSYY